MVCTTFWHLIERMDPNESEANSADRVPKKEPDLLEWLAQRLREAYPQMEPDQIKPHYHSVCIKFAVSGLSVDVVPVEYKGDPDDRGYLFPNDGGELVLTSIPLHLAFIRKRKDSRSSTFLRSSGW